MQRQGIIPQIVARGRMRALALFCTLSLIALGPNPSDAQEFGVSSRAAQDGTSLRETWGGKTVLRLALSAPVPWRVYTLAEPDRVVLDFREVDFSGLDLATLAEARSVQAVRAGPLRAGWSRMVLALSEPRAIETAALVTDAGAARLDLVLIPTDRESFAAAAGAPEDPRWPAEAPIVLGQPPEGPQTFTIVIDPGHGGIDPGAIRQGYEEADLMLQLALELEEALIRSGRTLRIILTRRADEFVSLERRVAIAAQAEADAFVSLHADAVAEGIARGASVFTLSDSASDAATTALVERHERADLLSGVDLSNADDEVAQVLIDLARQDSATRSQALAEAVKTGIREAGGRLHRRALQQAGFSVLKSADIPSILVEAGFLSTDAELERLKDPAWRQRIAGGIAQGILAWSDSDAATAPLRRQ